MINFIKSIAFKLLIIITLFCVFVNIVHAEEKEEEVLITPDEIQNVADKIKTSAGFLAAPVTVVIVNSPIINASMSGAAKLRLNVGLLNFVQQENGKQDMLASVVAHEMAHWIKAHVFTDQCTKSLLASRNCEREADILGIKLTSDAGYDCAGAAEYERRVQTTFVATGGTGTHPASKERELYFDRACDAYKLTKTLISVPYEIEQGIKK